jgi:hypothetical protein
MTLTASASYTRSCIAECRGEERHACWKIIDARGWDKNERRNKAKNNAKACEKMHVASSETRAFSSSAASQGQVDKRTFKIISETRNQNIVQKLWWRASGGQREE